jgi:hypothetical protein
MNRSFFDLLQAIIFVSLIFYGLYSCNEKFEYYANKSEDFILKCEKICLPYVAKLGDGTCKCILSEIQK